ncbi:hypothetical protein GS432_16835 [Rhodococcus hoagii]|nr:hypothetical protein [Prescottella equi]
MLSHGRVREGGRVHGIRGVRQADVAAGEGAERHHPETWNFSINKAAHALIGEPATVELLFDKENDVIALRPSTEAHAYAFRPQSSRDTGQVVMSATAFTQYFDIDTSVSRRFKPYEKDGMLCIDLRGPSVKVVGNRTKRTAQDDSEAQGAE